MFVSYASAWHKVLLTQPYAVVIRWGSMIFSEKEKVFGKWTRNIDGQESRLLPQYWSFARGLNTYTGSCFLHVWATTKQEQWLTICFSEDSLKSAYTENTSSLTSEKNSPAAYKRFLKCGTFRRSFCMTHAICTRWACPIREGCKVKRSKILFGSMMVQLVAFLATLGIWPRPMREYSVRAVMEMVYFHRGSLWWIITLVWTVLILPSFSVFPICLRQLYMGKPPNTE